MQRAQRDRVPAERRPFVDWLKARIGGRTYGQVAAFMGTDASTVHRWATGQNVPSRAGVQLLADYFKVPFEDVVALLPHPLDERPRRRHPEEDALADDIAERVVAKLRSEPGPQELADFARRMERLEEQMAEHGLAPDARASLRQAAYAAAFGDRLPVPPSAAETAPDPPGLVSNGARGRPAAG